MSDMKKRIALVSASPKVEQTEAVSAFLAARGEGALAGDGIVVLTIPVRHVLLHHETEPAFASLQSADAIVFIFPLYIFCLPAMLTRFLQDFVAAYPASTKPANVYAIINCGFPEPQINQEAMRVIECFSLQTNRAFLGGVMLGCGGMLLGAAQAPFMRETLETIDALFLRVRQDVLMDHPHEAAIVQAAPKFPRFLYFFAGNAGWRSMARKNKLRPHDLKRQPYLK